MKKIIIIAALSLMICNANTYAENKVIPSNFESVTVDNYQSIWQMGEQFKANGNQEYPDLFGRAFRKASTNAIELVTPKTMLSYIAFSYKQRLLDVPQNIEELIIKNNDIVYLATFTPILREGMFGEGGIDPQIPTQRLVIEKDNQLIRPVKMDPDLEALMPHSYGLVYYGFTREVILNVPYKIRYVTGYGDILSMDVTADNINSLIDDELHFYK